MCDTKQTTTAEALVDWGHDQDGKPLPASAAYYLPHRERLRLVHRSCYPSLTTATRKGLLDEAMGNRCIVLPWDAAHEFAEEVQETAEYAMGSRCVLKVTVAPYHDPHADTD